MQSFHDQQPDELDRLFARLALEPPPAGFAERVLARTARVEQASPRRASLALLIYLAALATLGVAAYQVGQGVSASGAADLLRLLLSDPGALLEEPVAWLLGLAELLPWWELGLAAVLAGAALAAVWTAGRIWALREELGVG